MEELAHVAYEAYRGHTGGVSLATGQGIPPWAKVKPEIQQAWIASVTALVNYIRRDPAVLAAEIWS